MAQRLRPDVIIIDPHQRGVPPGELVGTIHEAVPDIPQLVLSPAADDADAREMLLAGASGYLCKDAPSEQIAESVRAIARREAVVPGTVCARFLERARRASAADLKGPSGAALTPRELAVLRLLATGRNNGAIAESLGISPYTVKGHVASLFEKLEVGSRVEAAVKAVRAGLV